MAYYDYLNPIGCEVYKCSIEVVASCGLSLLGVGFLRKLGQLAHILQSRENMDPVYWKSIM